MIHAVSLREVIASDLEVFFVQQTDPEAVRMVAFTQEGTLDKAAFIARWSEILSQPTVIARTILCDGEVAGNIVSYLLDEDREVGYWLGKAFWGQGIATHALTFFLRDVVTTRPLGARVASDNLASLRVLAKCGFELWGVERSFAEGRGEEIEESLLALE
jgi:RimJ/RimL family protein N-acetyltransferase